MKIKGSKILVTGGLGFIGSHITESLVKLGAKVKIYDNYSTGTEANISTVKNDVEIIKGDILDFNILKKAIKGIDIVSHQAAQLEITKAIEDPTEDLSSNTIGTLNIFKACAQLGIKRIINASSAGVYGQAITIPQKESHPTEPNWAYGVSKLANEKYSNIMKDLYGLEITNFRYAIVYGPREWYGRVLTIFLKRALDKKPLVIFGNGNQVRDFIFVEDVVRMHNLAIINDKSKHEIFNVSTQVGTTINKLANLILEMTQAKVKIIYENLQEGYQSRYFERIRLPVELKKLVQSNQKAKEILGWQPKITLEGGLKVEWAWLKSNPKRWKKMSY